MLCANSSAPCGLSVSAGAHTVCDPWAGTAALLSCAIKLPAEQCWVQPEGSSICPPELFHNVPLKCFAVMLQVVYL